MTTRVSNDIKGQVFHWAQMLNCPDEMLGSLWNSYIGRSQPLDEKSAFVQVAQILVEYGVSVDLKTVREILDSF